MFDHVNRWSGPNTSLGSASAGAPPPVGDRGFAEGSRQRRSRSPTAIEVIPSQDALQRVVADLAVVPVPAAAVTVQQVGPGAPDTIVATDRGDVVVSFLGVHDIGAGPATN